MRVGVVMALVAGLCLCSVQGESDNLPDDVFDVEFHTKRPLGLRLDSGLKVTGFTRTHEGVAMPAEGSGWVKIHDELIAVNEQNVRGMSLNNVVMFIAKADLPKILRFKARHGENRRSEMKVVRKEEAEANLASGEVLIDVQGVPHGNIAFVAATFGRAPECTHGNLVRGRHEQGCGQLSNADEVKGAIVLLERGGCTFTDKAHNVQTAGGAALLVMNDNGPAYRMPGRSRDGNQVNIPVGMVSSLDATFLRGLYTETKHHHSHPFEATLAWRGDPCGRDAENATETETVEVDEGKEVHGFESSGFLTVVLRPEEDEEEVLIDPLGITVPDEDDPDAVDGQDGPDFDEVIPRIEFLRAGFGGMFPEQAGTIVLAEPADACGELLNAEALKDAVVVVERGKCSFEAKAVRLRTVGAKLLLVINTDPILFRMPSSAGQPATVKSADDFVDDGLPPSVLVSRSHGSQLRKAVLEHGPHALAVILSPDTEVETHWTELGALQDHKSWPKKPRDRKKLYFRLSRVHHPDKREGDGERFAILEYLYRRANHRYDPDNSNFVDNFA